MNDAFRCDLLSRACDPSSRACDPSSRACDPCHQYQEQLHLIDSHLDGLLTKIINIIREEVLDYEVKHVAFRCLYFISKVRGYKVVARHLPHETADLEPLLHYLENQDHGVQLKWETHYSLFLWLSIVVKIPFHLQRFDTSTSEPIMERILNVCKKYLAGTTKAQDMAFYVSAIYLTRPDVKDSYLPGFINWAHEVLTKDSAQFKKGVLSTLAGVFKHGQREQMMEHAHAVLLKKPLVKLTQRIGLIFLKPRVASWRYQRGSRSLAANLQQSQPVETKAAISVNDEDDHDYDVPEEIEEVLNEILQALRDKNREVQYSAAKGIGRLTSRLSKNFADQSDMAWHGGCLALAELARRGLLLPQRLSSVLSFVEQAMLYDELRGNFSVGSAVRDAACYLCWARSYDPSLLQPFVHQLAKALVITTVFDLRLRKNAYLQLSLFVAQYEEYRPQLIQHLVDRKAIHWDTVIRQLTSQALHQMTFLDPESMKLILSTQILPRCTNPELYLRHGSILASGKVISALCQVAKDHQRRLPDELGDAAMESITQTCIDILEERFWRNAVVDRWLKALRECLASADSNVQQSAISAVTALIGEYFRHQPVEKLTALLNHFLPEVTSNNQQARVGNALALGSMPRFLLTVSLQKVIQLLCTCALITDKTLQWAESRKKCSDSSFARGVDQVTLAGIFRTFIDGFEDYTVDSRGDIGAIVRESAMYSIQVLTNTSQPDLLEADLIRSVLHAVAKQSTEQIRRNRLLAPNFFSSLVYCDPTIPHIEQLEELRSIIPPPPLDISTEKECFDLWMKVMRLDTYRKAVITGLVSSIGSLTDSLVKSYSAPFMSYLRQLVAENKLDELNLVTRDILNVFQENLNSVRLMPYIFNFLDHLLSSGCLDSVFKSMSRSLLTLIRTEMTNGGKPLKLLISSVDLYCHLLRGDQVTFDKSIIHLLNLLVNRFPRVRKITAVRDAADSDRY
ncbi:tubulin-specific chaperone D-like [Daphnia pulicaria]|uniref:tubulin-specific chaperone D-like n=1 Tax=Daphnia pulicaria TaxID=35523 RepID=UPI001EEB4B17|nr:tubulin-specific chaperone D-like [Daphnia pulicaria]